MTKSANNIWVTELQEALKMRAALLALLVALHSCSALDNGLALRPPMGVNTWNVSSTHTLVSTSPLLRACHAPWGLGATCRVPIAPKCLHLQAFHDEINESLVKETADLLVTLGLKDAGYEYVNLDGALSLGCCFPGQPTPSIRKRRACAACADGWAQRARNGSQPINYNATRFPNGIKALAAYVHAKGLKLGIYSDSGNKTCAGYTASLGFEKEDAAQFADWDVDLLKVCDTRLRSLRCASAVIRLWGY